jgi:hypothetical protein
MNWRKQICFSDTYKHLPEDDLVMVKHVGVEYQQSTDAAIFSILWPYKIVCNFRLTIACILNMASVCNMAVIVNGEAEVHVAD